MKLKRSHLMALSFAAATCSLHGAAVTLTTGDVGGTSSFALAGNWNPAAAPSTGNTYSVGVEFLRTPVDAQDYTFGGDSLTLNAGGGIIYKGTAVTNTYTIANFVLNGGYVRSGAAFNNTLAISGGLTINGTGSRFLVDQSPFIINSVVTGTGELTTLGGFPITFTGVNTFTGHLTVSNTPVAAAATLAESSHWKFVVGANGVNNTITGTGFVNLNGVFDLDLTAASTTIGDRWTLVDGTTLTETYGAGFAIAGFTEFDGIWTDPTGKYQFKESTGVLSVIESDSDGDGLPDSWEMAKLHTLDFTGNEDSDGDFATNLQEYDDGTDPLAPLSFADNDGDGLGDGWELYYFKSLAYGPDEDYDGDFSTNLEEYVAGKEPNFAGSYPDADNDGIADGWEFHYFGSDTVAFSASLVACAPGGDLDGDLFTNFEEFEADTDPSDQVSSPDTDADGLPDGWEVKYFRVGTDDLATTIARHNGLTDPDVDGYDNGTEYRFNTNPSDATSVPGPLAWWRFGESTTGSVPGDEGGTVYNAVVLDSTGNGNAMRTWNDQTAPAYSTDVPFATVPVNGQPNTSSLYYDAGTDGSWSDVTWTDTFAPVRSIPLTGWTVELSFKMDPTATGNNQAVFSKDGNPLASLPMFHLKYIAATGKFEVGLIDGSGAACYLESGTTIAAGQWYSVAATANATTLSLWIKKPGDSAYLLEGTVPIQGAFYNSFTGFNDAWAAGRARWNGGETDWFKGWIDEIRISAGVLNTSAFLASAGSSTIVDSDGDGMDDAWESTWFGGLTQTATGDFDGDGTSNIAEYRLGLTPNSGASRFAATRSVTGALSWPSAPGVTFSIQRSTSMAAGSWTKIGTVAGTAVTATFTDPAPPAGHAFYRILLEP